MRFPKSYPIEKTDENKDWAMKQVRRLECYDRFPKTEEGVSGYVDGFMRIVSDQPELPAHSDGPDDLDPFPGRPFISAKATGEWLIDEALSQFDRLPTVRDLWLLYHTLYTSYTPDGKRRDPWESPIHDRR